MGNEAERKQAYRGLVHATGFLQARVAARLQTRFTPVLSFKHDDSVKKSVELACDRRGHRSDQRPEAGPVSLMPARRKRRVIRPRPSGRGPVPETRKPGIATARDRQADTVDRSTGGPSGSAG